MNLLKKGLFTGLIITGILSMVAMTRQEGIHGQVVCFGDSITHGAHVNGHSWVYFLNQEHHKGIDFINEGRNGRTTSDKLELLPVLKKYSHANYYLIFLGVNDLLNGTLAMVDQCVINMNWMINHIKKVDPDAHIVVLAPTDINLKTMSQINVRKKYNENTKRSLKILNAKYRSLAKTDGVKFISLFNVVSKPNYVDGLHPDIKGQKQIASAVWKGLNEIF